MCVRWVADPPTIYPGGVLDYVRGVLDHHNKGLVGITTVHSFKYSVKLLEFAPKVLRTNYLDLVGDTFCSTDEACCPHKKTASRTSCFILVEREGGRFLTISFV